MVLVVYIQDLMHPKEEEHKPLEEEKDHEANPSPPKKVEPIKKAD